MSDGVVKYVFGGVGSNVDSEVVNEDDKVVELVVEDEVDSDIGSRVLIKVSKDGVEMNIDGSVDCGVGRSYDSGVGRSVDSRVESNDDDKVGLEIRGEFGSEDNNIFENVVKHGVVMTGGGSADWVIGRVFSAENDIGVVVLMGIYFCVGVESRDGREVRL